MKFIIDAHLPRSIGQHFAALGHEIIHTSELKLGNRTGDNEITIIAVEQNATVISKDSDFYHSFLLFRKPPKLVVVKIGNMKLADVKSLFKDQAEKICELLNTYDLLEVYGDKVIAID